MDLALWAILLLVGIAVIQWGASRVASLLGLVRNRFGLSAASSGAVLGVATASPEISINVASAVFGWPDIGLGTALGSNVPALPLILTIGYVSMRWHACQSRAEGKPPPQPLGERSPALQVKRQSVFLQALPYLLMVGLVALLTLPPAWAGLQPIDALILFAAFALYFGQAVLRKRERPDLAKRLGPALPMALGGIAAIALGAIASVWATDTINQKLGISPLVGGLFITGLLCALPESFTAWPLGRDGRATAMASTAIADGTLSISLAFMPLALRGTQIGDVALYVANLATIAVMIVLYIFVNRRTPRGFTTGREVLLFDGAYVLYLAAVVYVLLRAASA